MTTKELEMQTRAIQETSTALNKNLQKPIWKQDDEITIPINQLLANFFISNIVDKKWKGQQQKSIRFRTCSRRSKLFTKSKSF